MAFAHRSRFTSSLLAFFLAVAWAQGVSFTDSLLPTELSPTGYLKVSEEGANVRLASAQARFLTGERTPLIQKNLNYYVGLIESDYFAPRLFAVPRITREGQGTAWVTQENELIFGTSADAEAGIFYFRPGEWLAVVETNDTAATVLCERYGKQFTIEIPSQRTGFEFMSQLPLHLEHRVLDREIQFLAQAQIGRIINDHSLEELYTDPDQRAGLAGEPGLAGHPSAPTEVASAPRERVQPLPFGPPSSAPPAQRPEPIRPAQGAPAESVAPSKWLISNVDQASEPLKNSEVQLVEPAPTQVAFIDPRAMPDANPLFDRAQRTEPATQADVAPEEAQPSRPAATPALAEADAGPGPEEAPTGLADPEPDAVYAAAPITQPATEPVTQPDAAPHDTTSDSEPQNAEIAVDPEPVAVAAATAVNLEPPLDSAPEEDSVASVDDPSIPEAAPEDVAAATSASNEDLAGAEQAETGSESLSTQLGKVILLLGAVVVAAVLAVVGLALALNRRRGAGRKGSAKEKTKATPAEGKARRQRRRGKAPTDPVTPAAPPPPVPAAASPAAAIETSGEHAPPQELQNEFSRRMADSGGVFTGSLDGLTVSQLIQFIHSVEETGALSVTHGSGSKAGKVIFNRGEITDVQYDGHRGEDALREVVMFKDGIFAFTRQPVDRLPVTVHEGTMSLLMNVLKTVDEEAGDRAAADEIVEVQVGGGV